MNEDELRVPFNRSAATKGMLLMLGLAGLFVVCYVFRSTLAASSNLPDTLVGITSLVGAALFLTLSALFLRRAVSSQPYVVITSEGIRDNGSGTWSGAGWIDWDEVADIRVSTYNGHPSVELILQDEAAFMQRFTWIKRIDHMSFGHSPIVFRPPFLSVPEDVLAKQMRSYWEEARRSRNS